MTTDRQSLRVRVNGEEHALPGPMTVHQLLAHLGIDDRQVAVERNRAIVPRADHGRIELGDGDELEVVTFVGGG